MSIVCVLFPYPASLQLFSPLTVALLFDFIILLICLTGLYKHMSNEGTVQSQFWQLLRRQGLLVNSVASWSASLTTLDRDLLLPYLIHCNYLSFHLHRP